MGAAVLRWRPKLNLVLFLAPIITMLALLVISGYHAAEESAAPGLCEKLCADFLTHKITAEHFVKHVQPPWKAEALRRRGSKITTTLPISGTVTLRGRDDHSGAEIAGFVVYDKRESRRTIITSPFRTVTDKKGLFDLSTLQLEAWEPRKSTSSSGGLLWNTCEATAPLLQPTAQLLIRHAGFDSRFLKVYCDTVTLHWARVQSGGTDKAHLGAIELLPAGSCAECYKAFGYRSEQRPGGYSYYPFAGPSCDPSQVKAHLLKHPDCPIADDALYGWLLTKMAHYKDNLQGIADAKELLRSKFKDGRDNTGLLISLQPGVSLDGSWEKGIEELQSRYSRR